jgi:hypothetical protein
MRDRPNRSYLKAILPALIEDKACIRALTAAITSLGLKPTGDATW